MVLNKLLILKFISMKNLFSLLLVFFGFVSIASASVATVPIFVDSHNDVFQDVPIVLTVSDTSTVTDSTILLECSVFQFTEAPDVSTPIFETYFLTSNSSPDSYSFMDPGSPIGDLNLIYNQKLNESIDLQNHAIRYRIQPYCSFKDSVSNNLKNEFWTGNYLV